MELSLVDYDMVHYHPSEIAAAALFLTRKILDEGASWTADLQYYSSYTAEQLLPVAQRLAVLLTKAGTGRQLVRLRQASSLLCLMYLNYVLTMLLLASRQSIRSIKAQSLEKLVP